MDVNTGAQQDLRYRAARFNEKGCLPAWDGDAPRPVETLRRYIPPAPSPTHPRGHPPMSSVQASLLGHAWFCVGFEQSSKKLK
jgi:hypothetical protein